jgi:hypothetical protein
MKKLKQIEFNEDLIGKKGIVINFRKPDAVPPEVFVSEHRKALDLYYISAINVNGTFHNVDKNGTYEVGRLSDVDLLMYQEVEYMVFYINEYRDFTSSNVYLTKEDAIAHIHSDAKKAYIRTIKLVEEIE